jgi:hypothetical protein
MAAAAARVRGASDWPGVPTTPDWSDVSSTDDTYELASTWLPEPLARHTVRDYDLTAGFAAAETARLTLEQHEYGGSRPDAPRFETPHFETPHETPSHGRPSYEPPRYVTQVPPPPRMSSPYNPPERPDRDRDRDDDRKPGRKKPVVAVGGVALAVVAVAAAVMLTSGGGDKKDTTALQGATSGAQSSAPGQNQSGKGGADISGTNNSPSRSGADVPTSASTPAPGSNGPSSQAGPSTSAVAGGPTGGQQPSSTAASTSAARPPSSTASHPSTAPGTTAAPPTTSKSAPPPTTSAAPPPAPAPVPCSGPVSTGTSEGNGYNCTFDTGGSGSPVYNNGGTVIGYLHQGSNWVICQATGRTETQGQYYNKWWAYTAADNHAGWGWVNAVSAAGGDNDGAFGGVPLCNGKYGSPPS